MTETPKHNGPCPRTCSCWAGKGGTPCQYTATPKGAQPTLPTTAHIEYLDKPLTTPEPDMVEELAALVTSANARVTFDSQRDFTKPCFNCGTTTEPRKLERVGTWWRCMGNRGQKGDPIERPVCGACSAKEPLP